MIEASLPGSSSEATLKQWLQDQEWSVGPFTGKLRIAADKNVAEFDAAKTVSDKKYLIKLRVCPADNCLEMPGHTMVWSGNCLIVGVPRKYAIYRPNN